MLSNGANCQSGVSANILAGKVTLWICSSVVAGTQSGFQAILSQLSESSAATEESLRGIEAWLASTAGMKNEDQRTLMGTLQKQRSGGHVVA